MSNAQPSLDGPVMLVAGVRPNFMKIAPLPADLDRRGQASVLTHNDAATSDVFFEELAIRAPAPDHHLEIGSGSHAVQTARVMEVFEPGLLAERPWSVVVPGDVDPTLTCALAASKPGAEQEPPRTTLAQASRRF